METQAVSFEAEIGFLRLVLAANDRENVLWPPENSEFAVKTLLKVRGTVPNLDDAASIIGPEVLEALAPAIIQKRKLDNAFLGYHSGCHYCGGTDNLSKFDFALMRVEQSGRNWGEAAASVALSAVLLPLLDGGVFRVPGKSFEGAAVHLRLVACKACQVKEGNFFGAFVLNEKKAGKHPLWNELVSAGFTKFLSHDTLPNEFKFKHMVSLRL